MPLTRFAMFLCVFGLALHLARQSAVAEEAAGQPEIQRLADGAKGHVHPAICVAKSGAVLVAHFAEADGKILLLRSPDGGSTWKDLGPIADIGGTFPYPGDLTTLQDGRIVLTWSAWLNPRDFKQGRRPMFATSQDDGDTWSKPRALPLEYQEEAYIRHAIWERSPDEWIFPTGLGMLSLIPSSDTLKPFGDPTLRPGPLVQTKAGTLLHGRGFRSRDEGQTWQELPGFPAVSSYRDDLVVLDNGWVVGAIADDDKTFRLVASYDDGETWNLDRHWVIYDPGRYIGRACPQLAQLDNDHLGIVFWDANREQPGGPGVMFARVALRELQRRTAADQGP
ncbi:MAG: hypothetical protein AB7O62_18210 [Pirellulales bacterium]